jgi:hypothetical protein
MDKDFNISLSLDSDNKKDKKRENKDNEESNILTSIQEVTNNSTSATFMVAIVSHMILNSMKKS